MYAITSSKDCFMCTLYTYKLAGLSPPQKKEEKKLDSILAGVLVVGSLTAPFLDARRASALQVSKVFVWTHYGSP